MNIKLFFIVNRSICREYKIVVRYILMFELSMKNIVAMQGKIA